MAIIRRKPSSQADSSGSPTADAGAGPAETLGLDAVERLIETWRDDGHDEMAHQLAVAAAGLPAALDNAYLVLAHRDDILREARQMQAVLNEAYEEKLEQIRAARAELLNKDGLVAAGRRRASELVENAESQARDLTEAARGEARATVEEARKEAARIVTAAHNETEDARREAAEARKEADTARKEAAEAREEAARVVTAAREEEAAEGRRPFLAVVADDRGGLSLYLAMLIIPIYLILGLVLSVGQSLVVQSVLTDYAWSAARAGATALEERRPFVCYASLEDCEPVLERGEAEQAANDYLDRIGFTASPARTRSVALWPDPTPSAATDPTRTDAATHVIVTLSAEYKRLLLPGTVWATVHAELAAAPEVIAA